MRAWQLAGKTDDFVVLKERGFYRLLKDSRFVSGHRFAGSGKTRNAHVSVEERPFRAAYSTWNQCGL